jgi:LacI family transcriptional regulator
VPEDVALIGVDNWEQLMYDQSSQRHLTTVEVGLEEIGRLAARQLLEAEREPGIRYVDPQLVIAQTA